MLSLYPFNHTDLVEYLTKNPIVRVKIAGRSFTQTFKKCDGIRIIFETGNKNDVSFPCQSSLSGGKIEYNEDGFSRPFGGSIVWYFYTGPKPWQTKSNLQQSIEDWDLVFEGLKNFIND